MVAGDVKVSLTNNTARKCAQFDGTNDRVTTGLTTTYLNLSKQWSISFWMKTAKTATAQGMMARWTTSDPNRDFSIDVSSATEKLSFSITTDGTGAGAKTAGSPNVVITNNVWHHIVCQWDGANARCYTDGIVGTDIAAATCNSQSSQNLYIGHSSKSASPYFNGCISDVMFFTVALTATEVSTLYTNRPVLRGLVHQYKLYPDYTDSVGTLNGTNSGSFNTIADSAIGAAVKAQRVGANDKWLIAKGMQGQVITTEIEG